MRNKRSRSIQSSAAIIGSNDDLLMEILLFLPAKSLGRFKTVSKHWHSLISAPSFLLNHHGRRRYKPHRSFLLRRNTLSLDLTGSQYFICNPTINRLTRFNFKLDVQRIVQSCNGLLLLHVGIRDYYVFNPTTMQHRNLNVKRSRLGKYNGFSLMFDPSKSHHYRVVHSRNDNRYFQHPTSFYVYDSKTHKWKKGGEIHEGPPVFDDGVFWNDHIYFVGHENSYRFSPEDKIVNIPSPPQTPNRRSMRYYVMESNGHLQYLSLYVNQDSDKFHTDVFEVTDNEWLITAESIPLPATFSGNFAQDIVLLGMIRDEKLEDSVLLFHVPGKIMIYRFGDEVCKVLDDFRSEYIYEEGKFQFGCAQPLIESLALV